MTSPYDVPDNYANLTEVASPEPVENPHEQHLYRHHTLEEVRESEQIHRRASQASQQKRRASVSENVDAPDRWVSPVGLKPKRATVQSFSGRSDILVQSRVPIGEDPREFYLHPRNQAHMPPPVISHSEFVPKSLVEHLMRRKKETAIGVKFQPGRHPPDQITNMEGAMHTFLTPIVLTYMHGDYVYANGHNVISFEPELGYQRARMVLMSAAVQPDFENRQVMLAVAALGDSEIYGESLGEGMSILDTASKQDPVKREKYDNLLRRHMVAHLTREGRLPDVHAVEEHTLNPEQAVAFLETLIISPDGPRSEAVVHKFVRLINGYVVSLELLVTSSLHQLRNEISALEAICSEQGYVYTSDPPAIFAQEIQPDLLNRIFIAALAHLSETAHFAHMKTFAFNDYADSRAVDLLRHALKPQSLVQVVSKSQLFQGHTYAPLPGTEGALLVVHNNSDGFGQNIASEGAGGSLDGAIGASSSAAASLSPQRLDLLNHIM